MASCTDLARARAQLKEDRSLRCVLCRGDRIHRSTERGVAPMMHFLKDGVELSGFSAADRVVGRATAFLFVLAGVVSVFGEVMSEGALAVLRDYGVEGSYGELVPHILNREGTGICPMEQAVTGINDPERAHAAVEQTLARLRAKRE